jgi:hypothetical protein
MNKSEVHRFRAILTGRVVELERLTPRRDGAAVDRSADPVEVVQGASERAFVVSNLDREYSQPRNEPYAAFCMRYQALDRDVEELPTHNLLVSAA